MRTAERGLRTGDKSGDLQPHRTGARPLSTFPTSGDNTYTQLSEMKELCLSKFIGTNFLGTYKIYQELQIRK